MMTRHIARTLMISAGISFLIGSLVGSAPAQAGVNVNINIGTPAIVVAPPPVEVEAPPEMVFLPEPGIYVAIGLPFDIFFISGRYYYFHGGNWFWAQGYGGPWVHVVYKSLPPGLRRYKVERLREFREREYKVYKVQGPKFRGKHFVGVPGPGPKAKHEVKEQIKERHEGKKGR
jgi:hypothetical protein